FGFLLAMPPLSVLPSVSENSLPDLNQAFSFYDFSLAFSPDYGGEHD
ncbi:MAG: hypothetical protein RL011_448, partial [Pseudomonadota bacterium]